MIGCNVFCLINNDLRNANLPFHEFYLVLLHEGQLCQDSMLMSSFTDGESHYKYKFEILALRPDRNWNSCDHFFSVVID